MTYAVIETPDGGAWVNTRFIEHPAHGMFVKIPSEAIRAELAALPSVLISIGLELPEGLTRGELAWSDVLRTRARRARLRLFPGLADFMHVEWLTNADAMTNADALAELGRLAVRHG